MSDEQVIERSRRTARASGWAVVVLLGVLVVVVGWTLLIPTEAGYVAVATLVVGTLAEGIAVARAAAELRRVRSCSVCRTLAGVVMGAKDLRRGCAAGGHLPPDPEHDSTQDAA